MNKEEAIVRLQSAKFKADQWPVCLGRPEVQTWKGMAYDIDVLDNLGRGRVKMDDLDTYQAAGR